MELFTRTLKVDATGGAVDVTIPAGSLTHSAYVTNDPSSYALTLTDDGATASLLAAGEQVSRSAIPGLMGSCFLYKEATVRFPTGSVGTVSYVATNDIGPITTAVV